MRFLEESDILPVCI